jgi:hypothetical protein
MDATKTVEQGHLRTSQTRQGFRYTRKPGVRNIPRTDAFGVFSEGILDQQWYMELQPTLEQARAVFNSQAYRESGGSTASSFWSNEIDIVARRGWASTAVNTELSQTLRLARINLNMAVLGYRASTILLQPLAVADMAAFMIPKYGPTVTWDVVKGFVKGWVNPEAIKQESPALQLRAGGELAIEETLAESEKYGKVRKAYTRGAMALVQEADIRTAAGAWDAAYNVLLKNGYPEAEAKAEADFIMNMVSGSTEITMRPHILSRGEGARLWFTFGSFALNRWGIIAHDIIKSGVMNKSHKRKLNAVLAATLLLIAGFKEEDLRDFINEALSGRESKEEEKTLLDAFAFFASYIPFIGSIIEASAQGYKAQPPLLRTATAGGKGVTQIISGIEEGDVGEIGKGVLRLAEAVLAIGVGMPGTSQLFDLIEKATKEEELP